MTHTYEVSILEYTEYSIVIVGEDEEDAQAQALKLFVNTYEDEETFEELFDINIYECDEDDERLITIRLIDDEISDNED